MAGEIPNNVFVRAYRKMFTEPSTAKEAYGYWLFFIGAIMGVIGLLVFIWSTTLERGTVEFWSARQTAIVLSSIGLPVLMLGVVFRLPVRRSVDRFASVGVLICLAAAAGFVWVYPGNWNVPVNDFSPEIIIGYAIGMGMVVVAALLLPAITKTPEWAEPEPSSDVTADTPAPVNRTTFEIYADRGGQHRWRLIHQNGNIIADSGEGYASRSGVDDAIERVRRYADTADTLELETGAFQVYEDAIGEYRWRLLARNGRIIADSGQGYSSESAANEAVDRVRSGEDMEFEVYEDRAGRYRWRLVSDNGRIVADSGQGYSSEQGANDAVERTEQYLAEADTLELETGAFEIFEDRGGEYRWRLFAPNGEIIADSGEGYASQSNARRAIDRIKKSAPDATERVAE